MINGRKLNENISPNQRRLRLKELSGQKLTEREKELLRRKLDEVVSMTEVPKYHNRMKPVTSTLKSLEDLDDEDEIDLQELIDELEMDMELEEILDELGYYDEEEYEW